MIVGQKKLQSEPDMPIVKVSGIENERKRERVLLNILLGLSFLFDRVC